MTNSPYPYGSPQNPTVQPWMWQGQFQQMQQNQQQIPWDRILAPQQQQQPFDFAGLISALAPKHYGTGGHEITASDPTGGGNAWLFNQVQKPQPAFNPAMAAQTIGQQRQAGVYQAPGQVMGNNQASQGWDTGTPLPQGQSFAWNPVNPKTPQVDPGLRMMNNKTKASPFSLWPSA
jgi:hypothetical protein